MEKAVDDRHRFSALDDPNAEKVDLFLLGFLKALILVHIYCWK
jgi:hypothetical protein